MSSRGIYRHWVAHFGGRQFASNELVVFIHGEMQFPPRRRKALL